MAGEDLDQDEGRRDPAAYPFHCQIPTRFGDMDVQAHINNVATVGFYQEARVQFHWEHLHHTPAHAGWAPVVANLNITFLKEISYPATVTVGVAVGRIGRSSFTLVKGLFGDDGECLGLAETVTVVTSGGRSMPIPDELRARLEEARLKPLSS